MARLARTLLAFAALLVLCPVTAWAADVSASVTPPRLTGRGPWPVAYRLELRTHDQPEQLLLKVGATGLFPPALALQGPGSIKNVGEQLISASLAACQAGGGRLFTPLDDGTAFWFLDLPANSTSVVTTGLTARGPFELGDDSFDRLAFWLGPAPAGFDPAVGVRSPLPDLPVLAVMRPTIGTPRYLPLPVRLSRSQLRRGKAVLIRGSAPRALAGQKIRLRASHGKPGVHFLARPVLRTIGRVRVRRDGSFRLRWRPTQRGVFGVAASYRSRDPRFLTSTTVGCFPVVSVD